MINKTKHHKHTLSWSFQEKCLFPQEVVFCFTLVKTTLLSIYLIVVTVLFNHCSSIYFLIFAWLELFQLIGLYSLQSWHCVEPRGHVSWGPMCTQRPLTAAGAGRWPWPSFWWRFLLMAPSRASASSSRTWWQSLVRRTVESPGLFPSVSSSWPSTVSTADMTLPVADITNWDKK